MPSKFFDHKFEIGDFVSIVNEVKQFEQVKAEKDSRYYKSDYKPRIIQVIEIWAEYCYGGLQIHYKLKHLTKDLTFAISDFTEIELCEAYQEDKKDEVDN